MEPPAETESQAGPATGDTMDAVFDRYVERIYRFLYQRVGNREDAEDLTSEVFLKAARELDIQRSEASVTGWLFTVARTVLTDHWRHYYRYGPMLPFEDVRAHSIPATIKAEEDPGAAERQVEQILAALPERYRRVLELRFLGGLTIRETAEEMGVTPQNVKVIQHRALARAVNQGNNLTAQDTASAPAPEENMAQHPARSSTVRP